MSSPQTSTAQPAAAAGQSDADKEFLKHVKAYVDLHKKAEASIKLKPTKDPAKIKPRENELARQIYLARRNAKPGDIFTPEVSTEFRTILAREFHGPDASLAVKTIKQGEPVKANLLKVNEVYPDWVPFTTVPPTLLLKLPTLPPEVEYRIIDRYLVLQDVKANLIVDFIDRTIPPKAAR